MKGSPFTQLCRGLADLQSSAGADLHMHSTFSDGGYSPEELVRRAVLVKLKAIALTDHDTTAGVVPTQMAAGRSVEVIPGVEITAEFRGVEIHLLGYFIDPDEPNLSAALRTLRESRRRRISELANRVSAPGFNAQLASVSDQIALGRRHLARFLIATGRCSSMHNAFTRCLATPDAVSVFKLKVPIAEAIGLVRNAGGVASWAHPPKQTDLASMQELQTLGLQAVECVYPWPSSTQGKRLEAMAMELGMAITGGSDSHDPFPATRAIGSRTITERQLDRIRVLAKR